MSGKYNVTLSFFRLVLILAGLALLSSSMSFHSDTTLTNYQQIQSLDYRRWSQGDSVSLERIVNRASARQDIYWIQQAAQLGYKHALYLLVSLAETDKKRLMRLVMAADAGVAQAQYELSLMPSYQGQRDKLLQASAEQGFPAAQHTVANRLLNEQNEIEAIKWLEKSAAHFPQDAFSLANIYWQQKNVKQAVYWYQIAADNNHQNAQHFVNVIATHKAISVSQANRRKDLFAMHKGYQSGHCAKRILPIALSLANQVQAQHITETYDSDPRFTDNPMCLANPLWLDSSESFCEQQILAGRQRIVCDVTQLEMLVRNNNVTHIILLLPEGRAYVNAGLMYLNASASYSLFVHELAHFAGFADEYPIHAELAKIHCEAQTAPNLLFDGEHNYAPDSRLKNWQTLLDNRDNTKQVTLHAARTCINTGINAYKMTEERTFMEFHDTDNIPLEYQSLWRQQVINRAHWYPVAINLSRHYESQNAAVQSQYWREYAEQQRYLSSVTSNHVFAP